MEPLGHLAMGLLFALPAWMLWDGRTGGAFIAFVLATATLPDLDLYLPWTKHHGAFHTVAFVGGVGLVAGVAAVAVLKPTLERWWRLTENETVDAGTVYLFVTGGFVLGGVSHLVGDVLAADHYEPIEPLWPLLGRGVEVGLDHYTSPWLNGVPFAVAVGLHLAVLGSATFPLKHRFRSWRRDHDVVDAAD